MPNWTSNQITVRGSKEELQKLKSHVFDKDGNFDFNTLVPMPEEILNTVAGSNNIHSKDLFTLGSKYEIKENTIQRMLDRGMTQEEIDQIISKEKYLIETYGFINWYDWALTNWGVKWNANETSILDENDTTLVFCFDTAWSTPEDVYIALFKTYPNLLFVINCEFEGDDTGVRYISDGTGDGKSYDTKRVFVDDNGRKFTEGDCEYDEQTSEYITPYGERTEDLYDFFHSMEKFGGIE